MQNIIFSFKALSNETREITQSNKMTKEVRNFYKNLQNKKGLDLPDNIIDDTIRKPRQQVLEEDINLLEDLISNTEMQKALKLTKNKKAIRLDTIPSEV